MRVSLLLLISFITVVSATEKWSVFNRITCLAECGDSLECLHDCDRRAHDCHGIIAGRDCIKLRSYDPLFDLHCLHKCGFDYYHGVSPNSDRCVERCLFHGDYKHERLIPSTSHPFTPVNLTTTRWANPDFIHHILHGETLDWFNSMPILECENKWYQFVEKHCHDHRCREVLGFLTKSVCFETIYDPTVIEVDYHICEIYNLIDCLELGGFDDLSQCIRSLSKCCRYEHHLDFEMRFFSRNRQCQDLGPVTRYKCLEQSCSCISQNLVFEPEINACKCIDQTPLISSGVGVGACSCPAGYLKNTSICVCNNTLTPPDPTLDCNVTTTCTCPTNTTVVSNLPCVCSGQFGLFAGLFCAVGSTNVNNTCSSNICAANTTCACVGEDTVSSTVPCTCTDAANFTYAGECCAAGSIVTGNFTADTLTCSTPTTCVTGSNCTCNGNDTVLATTDCECETADGTTTYIGTCAAPTCGDGTSCTCISSDTPSNTSACTCSNIDIINYNGVCCVTGSTLVGNISTGAGTCIPIPPSCPPQSSCICNSGDSFYDFSNHVCVCENPENTFAYIGVCSSNSSTCSNGTNCACVGTDVVITSSPCVCNDTAINFTYTGECCAAGTIVMGNFTADTLSCVTPTTCTVGANCTCNAGDTVLTTTDCECETADGTTVYVGTCAAPSACVSGTSCSCISGDTLVSSLPCVCLSVNNVTYTGGCCASGSIVVGNDATNATSCATPTTCSVGTNCTCNVGDTVLNTTDCECETADLTTVYVGTCNSTATNITCPMSFPASGQCPLNYILDGSDCICTGTLSPTCDCLLTCASPSTCACLAGDSVSNPVACMCTGTGAIIGQYAGACCDVGATATGTATPLTCGTTACPLPSIAGGCPTNFTFNSGDSTCLCVGGVLTTTPTCSCALSTCPPSSNTDGNCANNFVNVNGACTCQGTLSDGCICTPTLAVSTCPTGQVCGGCASQDILLNQNLTACICESQVNGQYSGCGVPACGGLVCSCGQSYASENPVFCNISTSSNPQQEGTEIGCVTSLSITPTVRGYNGACCPPGSFGFGTISSGGVTCIQCPPGQVITTIVNGNSFSDGCIYNITNS